MFLQPATKPGRPLSETIDWNLDVIRHADACGFAEVWIGQHITSPWEPLPAPQQIIARAIGETSHIKLGTGVEVLYQSHPYVWRQNSRNSITWHRAPIIRVRWRAPRRTRSSMEWILHRVNIRKCLGRRWTSS